MAIIKCKMCGGDLRLTEGSTIAECEYCGSRQTVPSADNEKTLNLFARANRLRANNEFDKASGVYESIVADFPEEAEAYWGLILCKYGIEYVDDPATGKKIPTCHRSSFDSVMDDSNFELVMEYSDPIARRVYREEAKQIEELRKSIIEVSSKEEPYDIFICYKETDENGDRTLDSVLAQDVYDMLTENGYRVFFSRVTLEDKLGQEYEPYIFAALNSAKIMLAFGTDYECYNAVWVKNEWSRFLKLIGKGAKKTLIPCYKGIDAYDMPKEFARLQAQDMGKIGALQDLLRGIRKILGSGSRPITVGHSATANAEPSPLTQRGNIALEDGDFENADNYFERALDANPSDARAYLGKFLAYYGLSSLAELDHKVCLLDNNKEFKRAEQFADPALAKELKLVRESNAVNIERLRLMDVIRRIAEKKAVREAMQLMARCTDESYNEAIAIFDRLLKNRCIKDSKCRSYKKTAITQFTALKYLKNNLDICSQEDIFPGDPYSRMFPNQLSALNALVEAGLIEKHPDGYRFWYCWPGAKEEKERLQREAEELRQKQIRQKAAYDKACEEVYRQIQDEESVAASSIDKEYDAKINEIQRVINETINAAIRQRETIQHQISDLDNQRSSLGFFRVKEKKALLAQIDDAQSRLNIIPSQKEIQARFQPQIEQLNAEKNEAFDRRSKEIRSRYTLPKAEDFADT